MYSPNDRVVHPMHGAGIIEEIVDQRVNGETKQYYVLSIPSGSVRLLIPVDGCENTGLRAIISEEEARAAIEDFREIEVLDAPNWNKRYRENMDRLKTGKIIEVERVYKGLLYREKERGLSTGEHKMCNTAKQILFSELSAATGMTFDEIEAELRARL